MENKLRHLFNNRSCNITRCVVHLRWSLSCFFWNQPGALVHHIRRRWSTRAGRRRTRVGLLSPSWASQRSPSSVPWWYPAVLCYLLLLHGETIKLSLTACHRTLRPHRHPSLAVDLVAIWYVFPFFFFFDSFSPYFFKYGVELGFF